MSPKSSKAFNALEDNIQKMIKLYRGLLDVVRKEKEILIEADLKGLDENNKTKEDFLLKLRSLEEERIELVESFYKAEGIESSEPKLLDLAKHVEGEAGKKLRNFHSVLVLLLNRIRTLNGENESLVRAALENVNGAMTSIKETLAKKPVYQSNADKSKKPKNSEARIVSKQV